MDRSIEPENQSNLTALFLGELDPSEQSEFEQMLEDSPEMLEEFESIQEISCLLAEGFEDELKTNDIAYKDEAHVTSYALDELPSDMLAEFEQKMQDSPDLKQDVESIQLFTKALGTDFEREWFAHCPVDVDNLNFSNFAAGETSGLESAQVEASVNGSSVAKKEVEASQDMMDLLSASLKDEWQSNLNKEEQLSEPQLVLFEPEEVSVNQEPAPLVATTASEQTETVHRHNFAREGDAVRSGNKRRPNVLMTLAAVLTGILVVGAMIYNPREASQNYASLEESSKIAPEFAPGVWKSPSTTVVAGESVKVPTLMLVDELTDSLESIDIATAEEATPSYDFGQGHIQPASYIENLDPMPATSQPTSSVEELGGFKFDQLPPIEKGKVTYSVRNGDNNARSILMSDRREHANGLQSVYVQGLFTFPEGTDFDVNTVFEPKKVQALSEELERVKNDLESTISELENPSDVNLPELKRKLIMTLEHYKELDNQLRSR